MRYLVANVVYTNPPWIVRRALRQLIREHEPHVLMLCETKNVDVRRFLDRSSTPHGWHVHQGRTNLGRRNATIAWRAPVHAGRRRFILGTLPNGFEILTRWITRARLSWFEGAKIGNDVMHLAPYRFNVLNRGYLRQIARHGQDRRYHHVRVGVNSRLDTLQAAILLPKLRILDEELSLRREVADRYSAWLRESGVLSTPVIAEGSESASRLAA